MALPNLSNSSYVAWLRHIQTFREPAQSTNPDTLVKHFLRPLDRWRAWSLSQADLDHLRSDPFYYYLLARTKYYDEVIERAVLDGVRKIIGIGCGSDTRPYRFAELLRGHGVRVLECDQPIAIRAKQRIVSKWRCSDFVDYMPIDLNDDTWPDLVSVLGAPDVPKTLVMLEGVSPYIDTANFRNFLQLLGRELPPRSLVAYDFKVAGTKEDFGAGGRTRIPFRLSPTWEAVSTLHRECGMQVTALEGGPALTERFLPALRDSATPLFHEDWATVSEVMER